ncbi:MAG: YfhO family protein [Chloroflexi bacterium]|nr:YfhO family protein [Chloroflexota bacterium]
MYGTTAVDIRIITSDNILLILTDSHYPGWHATLDGKETAVYRTNSLFRGVVVPSGEHTVHFEYTPIAFWHGLFIGTIALLIWLIGLVRQSRHVLSLINPVYFIV